MKTLEMILIVWSRSAPLVCDRQWLARGSDGKDNVSSKPLQRARQNAAKRIGAGAGEQDAQRHQQNSQGELHSAFANVEAVRPMDSIDRANHNDDDTDRPDTSEGAEKDSQSACELRQPNQVAVDHREMLVGRKALRSRAAKCPKQNATAVVQNRECARYAQDKKRKVRSEGSFGCGDGSVAHRGLLIACKGVCRT